MMKIKLKISLSFFANYGIIFDNFFSDIILV